MPRTRGVLVFPLGKIGARRDDFQRPVSDGVLKSSSLVLGERKRGPRNRALVGVIEAKREFGVDARGRRRGIETV